MTNMTWDISSLIIKFVHEYRKDLNTSEYKALMRAAKILQSFYD